MVSCQSGSKLEEPTSSDPSSKLNVVSPLDTGEVSAYKPGIRNKAIEKLINAREIDIVDLFSDPGK